MLSEAAVRMTDKVRLVLLTDRDAEHVSLAGHTLSLCCCCA